MVTKDLLRQLIYEQRELQDDLGTIRNIDQSLMSVPEILVISGVRRCGKSVLMQQLRSRDMEGDYFFSFDDERLIHFTVDDFQTLCEVFAEEFGPQKVYYLDELQLIPGWERFAVRLYNYKNKVVITGSNAFLLSKELGTFLTGRHITQELFPMSLAEYSMLRGIPWERKDFFTTEGRARLQNMQNDYLCQGGFPQFLQTGNPRYLRDLYNDIIYRDIVVRHKLPSDRQIREVAYYLASNCTHRFTYNSVAKASGVKSAETVTDYIGYLEEAYLVGVLTKYDFKVGEQLKSPKKIYFIDNALVSQIGFSFSENAGERLENAVYIELRRRELQVYYYSEYAECDFIVRDRSRIVAAYQVTLSMKDERTCKREKNGLIAAMDTFGLETGTIITLDESGEEQLDDGRVVHILPYYRWVLA